MSRILAIVPAYNEEQCIKNTIDELRHAAPEADYIIVNDGSRDDTEAICAREGFNYLSLPINCGLTAGFQTGMKYALAHNYDAVVQFDADGQHIPDYIPTMYTAMCEQHADIVIAARMGKDRPRGARGMGSKLISRLIRLVAHISLTDPTSGMRMFNKRYIRLYAEAFDLAPEPDALAYFARGGARIIEVPVKMRERQGGSSYFDLPHIISYMSRTCMSILLFQWFR